MPVVSAVCSERSYRENASDPASFAVQDYPEGGNMEGASSTITVSSCS